MPLPVDFKIDKIVRQISQETGVSYEKILAVINQQIDTTIIGMERGDIIEWKYFGKFIATKSRIDNLNKTYESKGKKPTLVDTGFYKIKFNK